MEVSDDETIFSRVTFTNKLKADKRVLVKVADWYWYCNKYTLHSQYSMQYNGKKYTKGRLADSHKPNVSKTVLQLKNQAQTKSSPVDILKKGWRM